MALIDGSLAGGTHRAIATTEYLYEGDDNRYGARVTDEQIVEWLTKYVDPE